MKKFFKILLAVLLCTTAMCQMSVSTIVRADLNTSKSTTVVENKADQTSVQKVISTSINSEDNAYSEEEVFLAAQLIYHEAHNQSYNGKVAVAEVLLNRIKSGMFPNTVDAVVSQQGQFSHSRRIKNIQPTEQELRIANSVLNGNLRVFNDSDVLYFRNPKITSGISAKLDKDWGALDYVTYIGDHAFYAQDDFSFNVASSKASTQIASKENSKDTSKASSDKADDKKDDSLKEDNMLTVSASADERVVAVVASTDGGANNAGSLTTASSEEDNSASAALVTVASSIDGINAAEVTDSEDDELTSEETILVTSEIMLAKADDLSTALGSDVASDDTINDISNDASADSEKLEEIDENDPVAVAQRQAKIDERNRVKTIAALEAANKKANDAATELAEANVQQAIDRIATLNKAGQVTVAE